MQTTTQHTKPESLILVIFGGSGDLTKRKLVPSLYQLFKQGKLPHRFAVLALGRTDYTDDSYRPHLDEALQKYLAEGEYDASLAEQLLSSVYYLAMDPAEQSDYPRLVERLSQLDKPIDITSLPRPCSMGSSLGTSSTSGSTERPMGHCVVSSSRSPSAMTLPQRWS